MRFVYTKQDVLQKDCIWRRREARLLEAGRPSISILTELTCVSCRREALFRGAVRFLCGGAGSGMALEVLAAARGVLEGVVRGAGGACLRVVGGGRRVPCVY